MFEGLLGVIVCGGATAWLISATRTEPMLGWFCLQYEVPDSAGARSLVRAYLFRTRVWRVLGACTGLVLAPVVFGLAGRGAPVLACVALGWMIGGLLGEIAGRRPTPSATVPSMLHSSDLLPRAARRTIAVTAACTTAVVALALASRSAALVPTGDVSTPSTARLVAVGLTSTLLAVVSWQGVRSICRQPLSVRANDLDLAEHAIRSASVVRVVGGWSALQLLVAGWLSWHTADAARVPWSWLAGGLAIGAFAGAAAAWFWMPMRLPRWATAATDGAGSHGQAGPLTST